MQLQKILVTGCGGDIGLGIGRILKAEGLSEVVYGCDMISEHAGIAFFDKCFQFLPADHPDYKEQLFDFVQGHEVDLVIPTSEQELRMLLENDFWGRQPLFLTANQEAMRIGFDKLQTAQALERYELPHPWTVAADVSEPKSYPCILKSRDGCGSKQVVVVRSPSEMFGKTMTNAIWQEYMPNDDEEYTCGLFRSARTEEVRSIIFRRKLHDGVTSAGEVVHSSSVEELLVRVAENLRLDGSINVQFRMKDGIPMIFEINPRFSSTVRFRHILGFHDLLWSLQDKVGSPLGAWERPMQGIRFYRIYEEVVVR